MLKYTNSSVKGPINVTVRAVNALSAIEVEVDLQSILHVCQNYSDLSSDHRGNTVCTTLTAITEIC